jgi:hypothetical protein
MLVREAGGGAEERPLSAAGVSPQTDVGLALCSTQFLVVHKLRETLISPSSQPHVAQIRYANLRLS